MNKKIVYLSCVAALGLLTACGGNKKSEQAPQTAETPETFEEQQIKAGMSQQLDSLTQCFLRLKRPPFLAAQQDGKVALTADEKKVKPDYLFTPSSLDGKVETLSSKYRALAVYAVDRYVAEAYEMEDVYTPAIKRLIVEINDPAINYYIENEKGGADDLVAQMYKKSEENGRTDRFWEFVATMTLEQTFIVAKNQDKYLPVFTDKDAEDITYRMVLLSESFQELQEYSPTLMKLNTVMAPLYKLDAISVEQLGTQLTEIESEVTESRKLLF